MATAKEEIQAKLDILNDKREAIQKEIEVLQSEARAYKDEATDLVKNLEVLTALEKMNVSTEGLVVTKGRLVQVAPGGKMK